MALAVAGSTTGTCTTGDCTLTSWTPAEGDTLLVGFATRTQSLFIDSVTGNGQTWDEAALSPLGNTQGQFDIHVYHVHAAASPSAGSVVVASSGNTKPIAAIGVRISGTDTVDPIGVTATNAGPGVDDDDMLCDITTGTNGSWALAFGSSRAGVFTVPGDEVSVSINLTAGSGGDLVSLHCWYLSVPTAGAVTVGAANDLGSARDWSVWVAEILVAAAAGGHPAMRRLGRQPHRPVEIGRKSQGGVWYVGSPVPAVARAA